MSNCDEIAEHRSSIEPRKAVYREKHRESERKRKHTTEDRLIWRVSLGFQVARQTATIDWYQDTLARSSWKWLRVGSAMYSKYIR